EGAGSPAEINLLDHDIVNLRIADELGVPAILVGDIDRGGVFAALYGTVALLPDRYRALVRAFVINKLRGDPALLGDGLGDLEARAGVPVLGVLPFVHDVALDAEDSLALAGPRPVASALPCGDGLDVAVVRFPRLANFTHLDALAIEPGGHVRFVETAAASRVSSSSPARRPPSPTSTGSGAPGSSAPSSGAPTPWSSGSVAGTSCWVARSATGSSPDGETSTGSAGSTSTPCSRRRSSHANGAANP